MPNIKTKQTMEKPKVLGKNSSPKDAATLLKIQYDEKWAEHRPKERGAVQYATEKVADTEGTVAFLAARKTRCIRKSALHRRERLFLKNGTAPKKKSAPSGAEEGLIHFTPVPDTRKRIASALLRPKGRETAAKQTGTQSYRPTDRLALTQSFKNTSWKNESAGYAYAIEPSRNHTGKAKAAATKKMQRQMARQNGKTVKHEAYSVIRGEATIVKTLVGKIKAAATDIAAVGGGAAVLVVVLLLILIGAIAASPFGILFSNESAASDSVPLSCAVAQVNYDFNAELEALQKSDTYDSITVIGETADWADALAVFAAKVAGNEAPDAADVVTMDADRISRLKAVFSDMNDISCSVDTIKHPDIDPSDGTDDSWTEKNLIISIMPRNADEMKIAYHFTENQNSALDELLEQRQMLMELVGNLNTVRTDAEEVLRNLPADLPPERRRVVEAACALVGKVNYFWGGKSLTIGWDSRWGTLRKVTAPGNSTTGTFRPYGLDCSGFVDWVFYNATDGVYYPGHGGGATMQHSYCSSIAWADALAGDLVFYPGDSHVGIVAGRDDSGNLLIIHCASRYNNVVITELKGFSSAGQPLYFIE